MRVRKFRELTQSSFTEQGAPLALLPKQRPVCLASPQLMMPCFWLWAALPLLSYPTVSDMPRPTAANSV